MFSKQHEIFYIMSIHVHVFSFCLIRLKILKSTFFQLQNIIKQLIKIHQQFIINSLKVPSSGNLNFGATNLRQHENIKMVQKSLCPELENRLNINLNH